MTEDQTRQMIQDEIAEWAGGENGLLDEVREQAFAMARTVLVTHAEFILKTFGVTAKAGPVKPEGELH